MPSPWLVGIEAVALCVCVAALLLQRRNVMRLAARADSFETDLGLACGAFAAHQHNAAVGSLTAPFAHGANNRLTVILSCLDVIATAGLPDADASHAAALATGAARRLADDMASLLAGVRREIPQPCVLELRDRLPRIARLSSLLHGAAIEIVLTVAAEAAIVADPGLFDATLLRIITFARRTGASRLAVTASLLEVESRTPEQPLLRKGRYCRLEFKLTGAELTERLLMSSPEPGPAFDRLRDANGLELAAVEAFALSLRGQASAHERPGVGPVLEVYLPAHPLN